MTNPVIIDFFDSDNNGESSTLRHRNGVFQVNQITGKLEYTVLRIKEQSSVSGVSQAGSIRILVNADRIGNIEPAPERNSSNIFIFACSKDISPGKDSYEEQFPLAELRESSLSIW